MTTQQRISGSISPQPGPQEAFLSSPADICIYGGAAGGGKTFALLLDPLRDVDVKGFFALALRKTYPEITNPGGLWDESEQLYPLTLAKPTRGELTWRWRSGARVEFGHLQHDKDLQKYDGSQITAILFDQLEHFSEKAFWYLQVRNRSTCGVPPRIRATCNPDPDSWLAKFLGWWIDEDGYANMSRAGKVRWFVREREELAWADTKEELIARFPGQSPSSVSFIPATVFDNKILLARNPEYLARLKGLPLVERERFMGDAVRGGNWRVRPAAGKVFNRSWFEVVDFIPDGGVDCRFWDFAATLESQKNDDPDYTASVKINANPDGYFYILDATQDRIAAGEIDAWVKALAEQDRADAQTRSARLKVRWEQEPGSAGVRESSRMARMLAGWDARGLPSTGNKLSRWMPAAAQAQSGRIRVKRAGWTEPLLSHLHGQPDLDHDDWADATAGAFNEIAEARPNQAARPNDNPWLKLRNI